MVKKFRAMTKRVKIVEFSASLGWCEPSNESIILKITSELQTERMYILVGDVGFLPLSRTHI